MSIKIEGYEQITAKIKTIADLKRIQAPLRTAALHLIGKLQEYPPQRHGRQPFKTQKQRRYFFWALKNNKIEVPYKRGSSPGSRNLKQRWRVVNESPLSVAAVNETTYGPYVQAKALQSVYHRQSGWPTDESVAQSETQTVQRFLAAHIQSELQR